jgi:hypothetical protein
VGGAHRPARRHLGEPERPLDGELQPAAPDSFEADPVPGDRESLAQDE